MRAALRAASALVLLLAVLPVGSAQAGPPAWDCVGPAPAPGDGSWEPAFASVPASLPDALEEARRRAERKLIERLCGTHGRLRDAARGGHAWRRRQGQRRGLRPVFLETRLYREWLAKRSTDEVRAKFRAAAEALLRQAGLEGKEAVVLVDKIDDAGAAGGPPGRGRPAPQDPAGPPGRGGHDGDRRRAENASFKRWPRGVDAIVRGSSPSTPWKAVSGSSR